MQRTPWIEKKFNFDFPVGWLPNILERLIGTSARLKEITQSLSEEIASYKPNINWSIKEHIGHLVDLEEIHEGRIDDLISRKEILRAADMENVKTNQSNHNTKSINQLIQKFTIRRNQFISRFYLLDDEIQNFKSLHPRLKIMMRPVDVAFFTSEHDDHHLASMREIFFLQKRKLNLNKIQ